MAYNYPSLTRWRSDERGAIMLIAVFMATVAIALLYYVSSLGETILMREHLQDAADAGALSGAIFYARAMNFLVLLNIVMAALLSLLVALKAVEGLCILGIGLAAALAWPSAGATLAFIPPLKFAQQTAHNAYESIKIPVYNALEMLHNTGNTVKDLIPELAESVVVSESDAQNVPGAQAIFWPSRPDLPVEDDTFKTLCGKAGEYAADVALLPIKPFVGALGIPGLVREFTSALSSWFCEDSGGPPPAPKKREKVRYPQTQNVRDCEAEAVNESDPEALGPACRASQSEMEQGKPDDVTGACSPSSDCTPSGPYATLAAAAFEQCRPGLTPKMEGYTYQSRAGTVHYEWTGQIWKRLEPRYEAPRREDSRTPPCGRAEDEPAVAIGYNPNRYSADDPSDVNPVCTSEVAPQAPPDPVSGERVVQVKFVQVLRILSCFRHEEKQGKVEGLESSKEEGGDAKSPKKIRDKTTLGDESFQLRVFVQAAKSPDPGEAIVRRALWGQAEPAGELANAGRLGPIAYAQAEYFFDGADGSGQWMWKMNWRARLMRFHLPESHSESGDDLCQGLCAEIRTKLGAFEGVFVH